MKKIFSILAAAVIALSFASCNNGGAESNGFKITVDSIQAANAHVQVVPNDTAATYVWTVLPAKVVATLSDDSIIIYMQATVEALIKYYAGFGEKITWADVLTKGTQSYTYTTLVPATDYAVIAIYFNEEGKATTGKVGKKLFSTPDVEVTSEVDLGVLDGGGFEDYRDQDGSYIAYATDDANYDVTLNIYDDDFIGNFTVADLEAEYSYIWTKEMNSEYGLGIIKAELESKLAGADAATISGWVVATNGIKYKFSFTHPTVEEAAAPKKVAAKKAQTLKPFNMMFIGK